MTEHPDGLPKPRRYFSIVAIGLAVTMSVLDGAIVNVALPQITRELGASSVGAIWIVNAYQLAITIALLPLASLGDSLGYKRVYGWGLVVFTLASALCAQTHSLGVLAGARMLQGLGAAGMMSVNIALVRFIYPRAMLGAGVGAMSLVVAAGSVAGPSLASAILAVAHWQWLFLINVPLGVLACLLSARYLPVTPASGRRMDGWSIVLNALTFGPLIFGMAAWGQAGHQATAALLTLAGLGFGLLFVLHELRLAEPLLPVDLLRQPVFALSLATSMSSFAAQTLGMLALPFFFEQSLERSESVTGLLMTPWPLATALVAPLAGRLSDRFAPERIASAGLLTLGLGLVSFTLLAPQPANADIVWRVALCGLGFGIFQSPNNRVIIGNAPRERSGGASGIQSMGRTLGQALGAVAVALIFSVSRSSPTLWMCGIAAGLSLLASFVSSLRRGERHAPSVH